MLNFDMSCIYNGPAAVPRRPRVRREAVALRAGAGAGAARARRRGGRRAPSGRAHAPAGTPSHGQVTITYTPVKLPNFVFLMPHGNQFYHNL